MADAADQATELVADDINQGVSRARGRVPDPARPGPWICEDCGEEEIPEGRRMLGHRDCIECARDRERRG